jgi:hypothetical protein
MIIQFTILALAAAAGVVGSIVLVAKDGYRRIPSRRA